MALQICDTSFPSGSLANSLGLESALHHGLICTDKATSIPTLQPTQHDDPALDSLVTFLRLTLEQAALGSLPFVCAAHCACNHIFPESPTPNSNFDPSPTSTSNPNPHQTPSPSPSLHPDQLLALCDIDAVCSAFTMNEVARRASLNQVRVRVMSSVRARVMASVRTDGKG